MGNFTDNVQQLTNFNPYIAQQNTDAMLKVGLYKQGQYDQGVERIQKSFDTIAGLQVTEKHKAYLQSKLNEMGNQMKSISAADFSNSQLVNNTSSQVNSIANDPIVQTGVSSALKQQKELEFMEKAREKGELTPQNELDFNEKNAKWYNEEDLSKGYNAKYTSYFDIDKHSREIMKELEKGGFSVDNLFETDANGKSIMYSDGYHLSKVMTTLKKEGKMPPQVNAAIKSIISDPRVQQQLKIDGNYFYQGKTQLGLAEIAKENINAKQDSLEDFLIEARLAQSANPENEKYSKEVEDIEKKLLGLQSELDEDVKGILENPNAYKSELYTKSKINQLDGMYNVTKTTIEKKDNPLYKADFEEKKYANQLLKEKQDFDFKVKNAEREDADRDATRNQTKELFYAKLNSDNANTKKDEEEKLNPGGPLKDWLGDVQSNKDQSISQNFADIENANQDFNTKKMDFIFAMGYDTPANNDIVERRAPMAGEEKDYSKGREYVLRQRWTALNKKLPKGQTFEEFVDKQYEKLTSGLNTNPKLRFDLKNKNSRKYEAYVAATKSKYELSGELQMQKKIDDEVKTNILKTLDNKISKEFKEFDVTVKQNGFLGSTLVGNSMFGNNIFGKEVTLKVTKQNARDLVLIAKYDKEKFLRDSKIKSLVDDAKLRMEKEGKSALWQHYNYQNKNIMAGTNLNINGNIALANNKLTQLAKFQKSFSVDSLETDTEVYSNAIRKYKMTNPNKVTNVFGGKDDDNLGVVNKLTTIVTQQYKPTGVNAKEFITNFKNKNLEQLKLYVTSKGIDILPDGTKQAYIENINNDKLYIDKEQAKIIGIDVDNAYQSKKVRTSLETIKNVTGTTSRHGTDNVKNFYSSTPVLHTIDFPNLTNSKTEVNVHVKKNPKTGGYYPVFAINKNGNEKIIESKLFETSDIGSIVEEGFLSNISEKQIDALYNSSK